MRKRSEDSLRESEKRFRELAELLPETVYEMDTTGDLTFVNQRAFDMFGYSLEDFNQGIKANAVLVPEDRDRGIQNFRRLMQGEELALAMLYEEMLRRIGYRAVACTSSLEALEAFRADADRFDLVITDLYMPKMTGIDFTKEFLKIRPQIPIILCTGFSEAVDGEKARRLGIREMLMKPILAGDLAQTIHKGARIA